MPLIHIDGSRARSEAAKTDVDRRSASDLERRCDVRAEDVIVSIVENDAADWSFGLGMRGSSPVICEPRAPRRNVHAQPALRDVPHYVETSPQQGPDPINRASTNPGRFKEEI